MPEAQSRIKDCEAAWWCRQIGGSSEPRLINFDVPKLLSMVGSVLVGLLGTW